MSKILTEKQVLKKLGIPNFRHLSKDKVMKFASMLPHMDPEVAKKALEQFPEFANTTKEILVDFKETLKKGMESNDKSITACYEVGNAIIASLQKELEKETHTFEQKQEIIKDMMEVYKMMNAKDSENKKFIAIISGIVGGFCAATICALASTLGSNSHVETSDDEELEEEGC